ncbi:Gypsy retrotransposon integrase-like protein 1 [Mizuhopecten yessoensis]|uniref:Gypsy retrotransposon integrase-like protein 1 n=1 Tax=Mizuhopecten yessoensis TaxID=6573 RepID=A0A210R4H9_MIZYE|nr:Gypsy retrotransposon integrase-like protein 1 [Mizuhopecten yessoensis]
MKTIKRIARGICDFVNVIEYMKHGKYPTDATDGEKRSLRKRSKSFRLDGENLYYLMNTSESSDDVSKRHDRLVVLTDEQRLEIIAEAHVDPRGVHLGREKATAIINKKYYWVGVSNMVREYSRACQVCRANRAAQSQAYELYRSQITSTAKEEDEFHDVETASSLSSSLMSTSSDLADDSIKMEWQISSDPMAFGEVVELSVLGPYKCQKSSRYVVVFLDVFSSWPEAYLLDTVTPADITHLVMKWVCRFGVMQNLNVKDCGPSCSTTQCQPLTKVLKDQGLFDVTIHQCSTVWNSSAQWNEVEKKVVSFIENNECWDKCLDFALLPLRISRGKDAQYTPSYLTFGREFRLPLYLSHRVDVSCTSATLDPHLTIGQMQCSTDRLVQLYTEYTSDMGKEVTEQNVEVTDKTDFKVPTNSNLSGKKRGKRKRGLQQTDKEVEENNDNSDVVYSTEGSEGNTDVPLSTGLPKGAKKRKPRHSQQLKDSKHIKTESAKEADNDGDFEKYDQEMCKISLDVFYRSILTYLEEQTYPRGSSEHLKRSVRKAHTSYSVEDGKLMYNIGSTGKKQVITTLKSRMELLKSAHIDSEGNHMPVRHVTKELSQYYWRGMVADCQAFVAACPTCDTKRSEKKRNLQEVVLLASIRKFEKIAEVAEKHYSLLIQYLHKSKFPPSTTDKDKTAVEKIASQFKLVKGVLYLMDKSSSMCVEIASRARKMAIKSAHASTGSAVPSFEELCGEVSQKYIWHSLTTDVHHYLTTLETTAQACTTVRPTNVEKKRLEFLEFFVSTYTCFKNRILQCCLDIYLANDISSKEGFKCDLVIRALK